MFSQQFHAWAHGTKSKLPPLVVSKQHGEHHRAPYNNNYCISEPNSEWTEETDINISQA
ncbi:hypothetical protein Bca52824_088092 [Brassica carinata]|uniref:Lipid desaturase domain-containing protein n=1 Tax=Brassica carinata TaxID=52824 RepID=A0A8X7P9F3_BRACI|nr:hypothetical protein Bca52824_088092 [Brassica carinata]